jgi:hypothetical protein
VDGLGERTLKPAPFQREYDRDGLFALKTSDASPNSRKEERMQLNIYALAKIAIMTDSLHAGCEWSEGEALRRNVDVRRVNARGCTINVYEVQIVPIGTIRIEVGW